MPCSTARDKNKVMQKTLTNIALFLLVFLSGCSQRHRAEVCNFSDVLACSLSFSTLEDIQSCVDETTGSACEVSDEVFDQINADSSENQISYTCSDYNPYKTEVESRGFSLTHFPDPEINTIYVDTLTDPFATYNNFTVVRTIGDAITSAPAHTQIFVCPGHYYENLTIDGDNKDGIAIQNIADGNADLNDLTVVQSLTVDSVLKINNALNVTIAGFTLQGGFGDYGGGVYASILRSDAGNEDYLQIKNSVIQDNTALVTGGGVYAEASIPVTISNSTVQRNNASYGGALVATASESFATKVELEGVTFDKNTAITFGTSLFIEDGAAVTMSGGSLTTHSGEISGTDFPAIHLVGSAKFSATETDFGSDTSENTGGDVFNAAEFDTVIAEFNLSTDGVSWENWPAMIDAWIAEFATTENNLSEQPWLYDFHSTDTVVCNEDKANPTCTSSTNTPTPVNTGDSSGDDTSGDDTSNDAGDDTGGDDSDTTDDDTPSFEEWYNELVGRLEEWLSGLATSFSIEETTPEDTYESTRTISKELDVRAQINGLEVFSKQIFPEIVATQMMNSISPGDSITVLSGDENVLGCDYSWSLKAKSPVIMPEFATSDLDLNFADGNKIKSDFRSVDATLKTDMKFTATAPSILCPDLNADFEVSAEDLSSTMTLTLSLNAEDAVLSVSDINDLTYSFDDQTVSGIGWWEGAKMGMFIDAEDANLSNIGKDELGELLQDNINTALAHTLAFSGQITDPTTIDYTGTPTDFETDADTNTLASTWKIDLESKTDAHSCATGLSMDEESASSNDALFTGDDFAVQFSYDAIEKILVMVGKTGLFCREFDIQAGDAALKLTLSPKGKLVAAKNPDARAGLMKITIPFVGKLSDESASQSILSKNVLAPQLVTPDTFTKPGSIITNNNEFTYNLIMDVRLSVNCDAGLVAEIGGGRVEDLAGTVSLGDFDFDVTALQSVLDGVLDAFLSELENQIVLAPKLIDIEALDGWAAELDEISAGDSGINLGLNLVNDYCE